MGDNENIRIKNTAVFLLLAMLLSVHGIAGDDQKPAEQVAASPEEIKPLQPGSKAPTLTLKTVAGKSFDLNAALAGQPTVLIFYRGGW
jgi:hypothetical protein